MKRPLKEELNYHDKIDCERDFQTTTKSHICGKLYVKDGKVRDHWHVIGKYRGSAQQSYNLNFKLANKTLVIFNNHKGYDCHQARQKIDKFHKQLVSKNTYIS